MKLIGTTARVLQKEDVDLYPVLANSVRFGNLYISDFINKIDVEQEKQFSAITVICQMIIYMLLLEEQIIL